jgi:hypothetical protein
MQIKKFAKFESTTEKGKTSAGSGTFFIKDAFSIIMFDERAMEEEKKFHGSSPQRINSGYLSIFIFTTLVKIMLNTNIVNKGFSMVHRNPNQAPLNFVFNSFRESVISKSKYCPINHTIRTSSLRKYILKKCPVYLRNVH